jgi:hypothetical protein
LEGGESRWKADFNAGGGAMRGGFGTLVHLDEGEDVTEGESLEDGGFAAHGDADGIRVKEHGLSGFRGGEEEDGDFMEDAAGDGGEGGLDGT